MTHCLRALAAVAEGLGLVPSTYVVAQNICNSQRPDTLLWPSQLSAHMCIFTNTDTHTYTSVLVRVSIAVERHHSRQGFSLWLWSLSWNLLSRLGWSQTHRHLPPKCWD